MPATPDAALEVRAVDLRLAPDAQARAYAGLSAAERTRAERFAVAQARRRYVAARSALRVLLAEALGVAPADVVLGAGPWGKPEVDPAAGLAFNLSHAGDLAVIALRRGGSLGVDVERVTVRANWERTLDRISAPREHAAAVADARRRGPVAFFERWVAKEAVAKAIGRGLALPFERIVLERDPDERLRLVELCGSERDAACWELRALDIDEGFVAALALARSA